MTDEQRAGYMAALVEERRGCELRGNEGRVEAIDAELKRLGQRARPPAQRAEKR